MKGSLRAFIGNRHRRVSLAPFIDCCALANIAASGLPVPVSRPPNPRAAESVLILALLLLCAAPVSAQTSGEKTADWISTGLVGVNLTAAAIHDVKHHCVKNLLLRNGLTLSAAELTKVLVHEDRPDHSDAKSFYSEHSALAMANYGWSYQIGFSIAVGAGAGRIAAEKHHPVDVLVGLAAGLGASYLFPCEK